MQAPVPAASWNVPASHGAHGGADPACGSYPAWHTHTASSLVEHCALICSPVAVHVLQVAHAVADATYLPLPHSVHAVLHPPEATTHPAGHVAHADCPPWPR